MRRDPLPDTEVAAALRELPEWTGDGTALRRTVTCAPFRDAVALVKAVADVAEALDHPPDVDLRYRDVTFACWTHTVGGVSEYDVELARRIEEAVARAAR